MSALQSTPVRLVFWAVLGAVVGVSLDALHVLTGTLGYPWTSFGVQPWWVIPLFAGAGLALGEGHHILAGMMRASLPTASNKELLTTFVGLVGSYASSGFLKTLPWVATALYVAAFAALWRATPHQARRVLAIHVVGTTVSGPIVEATLSGLGFFHYLPESAPLVLGVPVWLPCIYLHAALATGALDRRIHAVTASS